MCPPNQDWRRHYTFQLVVDRTAPSSLKLGIKETQKRHANAHSRGILGFVKCMKEIEKVNAIPEHRKSERPNWNENIIVSLWSANAPTTFALLLRRLVHRCILLVYQNRRGRQEWRWKTRKRRRPTKQMRHRLTLWAIEDWSKRVVVHCNLLHCRESIWKLIGSWVLEQGSLWPGGAKLCFWCIGGMVGGEVVLTANPFEALMFCYCR